MEIGAWRLTDMNKNTCYLCGRRFSTKVIEALDNLEEPFLVQERFYTGLQFRLSKEMGATRSCEKIIP